MNRTERLLDLIASLLDAREPVPFEEIRRWFPDDYDTPNRDAGARTFERDKATLLDLGIPIEYADAREDGEPGYAIDKRRFYLSPIDLTSEEAAVTFLAGSALLAQEEFPYREDLRLALEKLALASGADDAAAGMPALVHHPVIGGGPEVRERLDRLAQAVANRKRVTFTYHARYSGETTRRKVDPYGLFCRRGQWTLVGYSHEREAARAFLVSRMGNLRVNPSRLRTPDFDVPRGFDIRSHASVPDWRYDSHNPVVVEIDVQTEFAWLGEQEFGAGEPRDGWVRFRVEATNADALVEWALGMGTKARIAGPEAIRAQVRATLKATLARYGGSP